MTLKGGNARHYAGRKPNMPDRRPKRVCARCGVEEAARGRDLCPPCLDAIGGSERNITTETQRSQREV